MEHACAPAPRLRNVGAGARVAAAALAAGALAVACSSSSSKPAARSSTSVTTTVPATVTTTTGTRPPASLDLRTVHWAGVAYPIECGTAPGSGTWVRNVVYPAPAAGRRLAAVLVSCRVGAGTPPVELYLYDSAGTNGAPRRAATLVSVRDNWQASKVALAGAELRMPVYGFSSASIPNCCPDVRTTLVWTWNGSAYRLASAVPAHFTGR